MKGKTLVVFGSKYGATAEIADKIGEALSKSGMAVDVMPAKIVSSIDSYDTIIIGSALYIGQWRKEVIKFINNNQNDLMNKKVWIFTSGPTGDKDPVEGIQGKFFPDKLKAVINTIKPKEITVFHGNLNEEKLSALEKFVINKVNAPLGDFRDWKTIERWAKRISRQK